VQDEERGEAGKDRFECQEYSRVGGWEMLLGPTLDRKRGGGGQKAGDGQGDEKTGRYGKVWLSFQRKGDGHDDGGDTDLEGCELAGGNSMGCVGQCEQMTGECYGACEGKQIPEANAGEEILPGGSGRCCEEKEACEGEEGADGSRPAGCGGVCWAKDGNGCDQWDEDDDEPRDEGGFGCGRAGQACGLELITCGEEKTDDGTRDQGRATYVTELTVINDGQSDEGQGHAKEIKEQGRGVLEGILDQDERHAPDGYDCQQQDVGEGGWAEASRQIIRSLLALGWGLRFGVDGFAVDYGAEHLGVEEFLWSDAWGGYIVVEYDEVSYEARLEAAFQLFLIFSEGRGLRIGVDRLVEGDFFLGLVGFGSGLVLAGDGSVEAAEGVDGLDRIVGAEGQGDTVVEEGAPGVGVLDAIGAEAGFGPVHVGEEVRGLHGGDDVETGESVEVAEGYDLGMLDAVTGGVGN